MSKSLKKFLIICSGAEWSIIDQPQCAIEHTKYAGIGATVLSTAVLASLSGGYAIHTTFKTLLVSICLGIVWGLIIFNLDRYIVSSLRSERIIPTLSQRERIAIRGKEVARALPRLLLAVFISVVITRPIELKLFEREIKAQVESEKSQKLAENERQKRLEFPQIDELSYENQKLQQEIADKEKQRDDLHELAMSEALGKAGARTTGRFGKGIVFQERWQAYLRTEADLTELRRRNEARIAANEQRIAGFQADLEASTRAARAEIEAMDGLLLRLKAHSLLTDQNASIASASWFIIILFILLETAPVVVKLLSERGPYEDLYDTKQHEVYVSERIKASDVNDDANTRVSLNRRRNAAILEAEVRLRKSLLGSLESLAADELRKARREIATTLVNQWKGAELKNFESRFGAPYCPENGNRRGDAVAVSNTNADSVITSEKDQKTVTSSTDLDVSKEVSVG